MKKKTLPDSDTVSSVLLCIAKEKNWSSTDIEQDFGVLAKHRLVTVGDLRALSGESWTQIELLPLVKDLLRSSIDPHWPPHGSDHVYLDTDDDDDAQKKKKDNKQQKKKAKKKQAKKDKGLNSLPSLGTPVVPTILTKSSDNSSQEINDAASSSNLDDSLSPDHLTIQNTIRNGNIANSSSDSSSADDEDQDSDNVSNLQDDATSPNSEENRKSVSFSNETTIGVAASVNKEKKKDKEKKKEKKNDKKEKKKNDVASTEHSGVYQSFTNHPHTTHSSEGIPPVPANDQFLQGIRDKLEPTA